jgi:O-antigen/teichoic acid export membrane protein
MRSADRVAQDQPGRMGRRVGRNTLYLALADFANKLMMFLFFILAARHLGTDRFGVFSLALAYVGVFSAFTDLGLGVYTARAIARNIDCAVVTVGNCLSMRMAASVLSIGAMLLVAVLQKYPAVVLNVMGVSAVFLIANTVSLYYGSVFQGFERNGFTALVRFVQTAALITGALMLGRGRPLVLGYAWLYAGAGLLCTLLAWIVSSLLFVKPSLRFDFRFWGAVLRSSLPIGVAVAFVMFYYWGGTALLAKLRGNEQVGLFNAPFRLVMGFAFVAFAYAGAVYPVMSRLFLSEPERLARTMERSLKYMAVFAVPLVVFGSLVARPLVLWIYGQDYAGSAPVLRALVWWGAFVYMNSVLSNYFYSADLPGVVTFQTSLALALNVPLNLVLIPRMGALGVALALPAAEAASFMFLLFKQVRTAAAVSPKNVAAILLRVIAAAVPASAVAAGCMHYHLHVAVTLSAGLVLYSVGVLAVGAIDGGDLRQLAAVLPARNA